MREVLRQYIEGELRAQGDLVSIDDDDDLVMVGLDSIGFVRLVDFIENTAGLRIPPESVTIENFGTVGRITRYLEELENG